MEEENIQIEDAEQEQVPEPPKKKRVISPEAKEKMLENLQKAREARAVNKKANIKKYPIAKRERAKEMLDQDIDKRAEQKAKELAKKILEDQEREKELEEFRKWKSQPKEEPAKKPAKKKAAPKAKEVPAKKKAAPKKQRREEQLDEEEMYAPSSYYTPRQAVDLNDFLD